MRHVRYTNVRQDVPVGEEVDLEADVQQDTPTDIEAFDEEEKPPIRSWRRLVTRRCLSLSIVVGALFATVCFFVPFEFFPKPPEEVDTKFFDYAAHLLPGTAIPVLGDWGRKGIVGQQQVAAALATFCNTSLHNCPHIISVGDNFYDDGVSSVDDEQWRTSYEHVYSDPLLQGKWFVALGNHDHHKNNWPNEVQYANSSKKWILPRRYHAHEWLFGSMRVKLLILDTTPFVTGPLGFEEQLHWINQQMSLGSYTWKIAVGHHPIYSAGKHGDATELQTRLLPVLLRNGINLYLSGHDHNLQYLLSKESMPHQQPAVDFHQFISGSGAVSDPYHYEHPKAKWFNPELGFMTLKFTEQELICTFRNVSNAEIFSKTVPLQV
eukprot:GILK01006128.1.p1 GENE.GILK01006128.1~~GILK01006128.1.p1  ORF type:complete len:379 (+),score=42.07 GILK01006128.1:42-1178(+)